MSNVIIGNVVALIGSVLMVYSGFIKEKKKILYVQTLQIGLFVISNFVLGGITGGIINILCCIRNILSYKDKLGLKEKIIITILSVALTVPFNNLGIIGLLPMVSTVLYIWLINVKDIVKFKMLIAFTNFTWLVYDICILSYTSAIFDFMSMVANIITIFQINYSKKHNKGTNKNK